MKNKNWTLLILICFAFSTLNAQSIKNNIFNDKIESIVLNKYKRLIKDNTEQPSVLKKHTLIGKTDKIINVLDSIISFGGYNNITKDSIPQYKQIYKIDESGNNTLDELYNWDVIKNTWKGQYKYVYAYNSYGDEVLYENYSRWNSDTKTWIGSEKHTTNYNLDLETYSIDYIWNTQLNKWVNNFKTEYEYTDYEITTYKYYLWNTELSTANWTHIGKHFNLDWNDNNEISNYIFAEWNDEKYDEIEKYETTENSDKNIEEAITYSKENGNWEQKEKKHFTYNGNITTKITENLNSETGVWKYSFKYESSYNSNGDELLNTKWIWINDTWIGNRKYVHNYDEDGNQTLYESNSWDIETNNWKGDYKYTNSYNESGKQTLQEDYNWNLEINNWAIDHKKTTTYDKEGNEVTIVNYTDRDTDNNTWNVKYYSQFYYIYNKIGIINIDELTGTDGVNWIQGSRIYHYYGEQFEIDDMSTGKSYISSKVYPNPVSNGFINIELPNSNKVSYTISNTSGLKFKNGQLNNAKNTIEIGDLLSGVYLIKIETDTGSFVKKFIKQ